MGRIPPGAGHNRPGAGQFPIIVDLFAGAGGAGEGYRRAGFLPLGIDRRPSPRYPGLAVEADVFALDVGAIVALWGAVAVHASPPCQRYSRATREADRAALPDSLLDVAGILERLDVPAILENVPGAPWDRLGPSWSRLTLCGSTFGLPIHRHRVFAVRGIPLPPALHCAHRDPPTTILKRSRVRAGARVELDAGRLALGLDAPLTSAEAGEAIPPAFTHFLGLLVWAGLAGAGRAEARAPDVARSLCACGCGVAVYNDGRPGRPSLYASTVCRKRAFRRRSPDTHSPAPQVPLFAPEGATKRSVSDAFDP